MTARAVRYQNRLRAEGKCPHCRRPLEINPRTGKLYQYCVDERARRANAAKMRYYERKARA